MKSICAVFYSIVLVPDDRNPRKIPTVLTVMKPSYLFADEPTGSLATANGA